MLLVSRKNFASTCRLLHINERNDGTDAIGQVGNVESRSSSTEKSHLSSSIRSGLGRVDEGGAREYEVGNGHDADFGPAGREPLLTGSHRMSIEN